MIWYDMTWYDILLYAMLCYDMICYDMVIYVYDIVTYGIGYDMVTSEIYQYTVKPLYKSTRDANIYFYISGYS